MSNTNDFETGYQDDQTLGQPSAGTANGSTGFGTSSASGKAAKKKGSKLPLIIFGVVALAAIGGAGFVFLGGSKAPPKAAKPKPAVSAPADPAAAETPAADPLAADPAAAAPAAAAPALDPITGLPVTDPASAGAAPAGAAPALDPITGLPVTDPAAGAPPAIDPITGLPVTDPAAAAAAGATQAAAGAAQAAAAAQPTIDPITGLPVTDPAAAAAAQAAAGAAQAAAGAAQATQAAADPALSAPPVTALPAGTDPLAAFRDMLAPIDGRVTVLEGRVNNLESTVNDISSKVNRLLDRPASTSIAVSPRPAAKRTARKPASKPRATITSNYVRPAAAPVQPPVSRVVIVSSSAGASVRDVDAAPAIVRDVPVAAPSCNLQAIVPGRVWVKNADGSFASYGEGDRWNGQAVGTIDPARGVQVDGRWTCN